MSTPIEDNKSQSERSTTANKTYEELVKDLNIFPTYYEIDDHLPNEVQPAQNMNVTENYSTSYTPIDQEFHTDSGNCESINELLLNDIERINEQNNFMYGQINPPLGSNDSPPFDLNAFATELDMKTIMKTPENVNQPTVPIQQSSTELSDEPIQTNLKYLNNAQSIVRQNDYQQPPFVVNPTPSAPLPAPVENPAQKFFLPIGNQVLVLGKRESVGSKKPIIFRAVPRTASSIAPILKQSQGTIRHNMKRALMRIQSRPVIPDGSLHGESSNTLCQPSCSEINSPAIPKQSQQETRYYNSKLGPKVAILSATPKDKYSENVSKQVSIPEVLSKTMNRSPMKQPGVPLNLQSLNMGLAPHVKPNSDAEKPRNTCNCSKSHCLKLYCECFAIGTFCRDCNCIDCLNNAENEPIRNKAVKLCLERNPNALLSKAGKPIGLYNRGCNCKKSGCVKKYCECFDANIPCNTDKCKCVGCRNCPDEEVNEDESLEIGDEEEEPKAENTVPKQKNKHEKHVANLFTDDVMDAVVTCMLTKAAENTSNCNKRAQIEAMKEFSRCFGEIAGYSKENDEDSLDMLNHQEQQ